MNAIDVLIAGAGPTGLTLACGLAAQGIGVRIVDRAHGPSQTSRANILHARGVEVLTRTGAVGGLRERSLAPVGMAMHVGDRELTTMRFSPDPAESVQALFVSQASIEAELRRRLAELGVEIEWDTRVTDAVHNGDDLTVHLSPGSGSEADSRAEPASMPTPAAAPAPVSAPAPSAAGPGSAPAPAASRPASPLQVRYLIGCDGAHSTVRTLAGIAFPGVPVVEQFLLADVRAEWDRDRSTSAGWFHRDGMVLAIPMRDGSGADDGDPGLWRLMADVPPSDRRLSSEEIIARFAELIPERTGATGVRIRDAVWTSVFRIQRRLAADYRSGRMLLAGDAAHIHSPIGGQGMNTGIGDAENLAWKLGLVVSGRAAPALLDTYTAERRPLATDVLRTTTANTRVLIGRNAVSRFVRDRIFVPLLNLPKVQSRATRTASQLWVTYRNGPLGARGRGSAPRPGDRVADRPCARRDGTATRLHTELGPEWAVLAPEGEGGDMDGIVAIAREHLGPDVVVLRDPAGTGGARLIRPDGHLAWHGTDPAALRTWLTATLLCRGTA